MPATGGLFLGASLDSLSSTRGKSPPSHCCLWPGLAVACFNALGKAACKAGAGPARVVLRLASLCRHA